MGVLTEVVALAKQQALTESRSRLQALLADRAAGKFVDELSIRHQNSMIADLEKWFADYERQKLMDSMQQQARAERQEQEHRRTLEVQSAAYKQLVAEQEEREHELAAQKAERRAAAEQEYNEAVDDVAAGLAGIGDGVSKDDRPAATRLLLGAFSTIPETDARLFGARFHAAWRWVNHGEDPDNLFCDKEAFQTLDPDAYDSDGEYRAAVASSQATFLIEEFAQPWSVVERDSLTLEYRAYPAGLPEHHVGPISTTTGTLYLGVDKRRQRLVVYRVDDAEWRVAPHAFLPLAAPFDAVGTAELTHARGVKGLCLDQTGTVLYTDNKLYKLGDDAFPSLVAEVTADTLVAMIVGAEDAAPHTGFRLTGSQLVTMQDGTPLLLVEVRSVAKLAADPSGGWIALVDLLRKQVVWRFSTPSTLVGTDPERILLPAERWLYVPDQRAFVLAAWRQRTNHTPVEFALVDTVQRASGIATETARDRETCYALTLEKCSIATGEQTASLDLYGCVPGLLHDPASDVALVLDGVLVHLSEARMFKTKCGTLDLREFTFTQCAHAGQQWLGAAALRGDVGPNRLHTLLRMYRRYSAPTMRMQFGMRSAQLVRRDGAGNGTAEFGPDRPAFLFAPSWSRRDNRVRGQIHWLSVGMSPDKQMEVILSRDASHFPDLETMARSHMANTLAKTPDAAAGAAYFDLYGLVAIRAVVANVAFSFFEYQGHRYILVYKAAGDLAGQAHTLRQLDRQLTGVFADAAGDDFACATKAGRFTNLTSAPPSAPPPAHDIAPVAKPRDNAEGIRMMKKAACIGGAAALAGMLLLGFMSGLAIFFVASFIALMVFHWPKKPQP